MLFSYYQNKSYYRINVLVSDVSTGLIFVLVGVGILSAALYLYNIVHTNFSLSAIGISFFSFENPFQFNPTFSIKPIPLLSWTISLVLVDLFYYWFHRLTHEINILWACHVTHHSSEEFNFSVSFRGNAFQRIFEYLFYLPLAIVGIPWFVFLLCHRIMKIYQFVVHTRYVGKLGFLEHFMVTPSGHRVHHGTEPKYIDKNHGGIFIIWDKMFGTYEEEGKEPLYGITKQLKSFNPIWGNVHVYAEILDNMSKTKTFKDKLGILFKRPGWKPDYLRKPEEKLNIPAYESKYNPIVPKWVLYYSFIQILVTIVIGLATWKISVLSIIPAYLIVLLFSYVLFGLISINGILEGKSWANETEFIRNTIFVAGSIMAYYLFDSIILLYISLPVIISAISMVILIKKQKMFARLKLMLLSNKT